MLNMAYFVRPEPGLRPLLWVGSSLKDLRSFPEAVQDVMGYALFRAQFGERHPAAKALRGTLRGLMEIVDEYRGNAYRVIYTTKLTGAIYALHVFRKKATRGIATPKHEVELMQARYRWAKQHHHRRLGDGNG